MPVRKYGYEGAYGDTQHPVSEDLHQLQLKIKSQIHEFARENLEHSNKHRVISQTGIATSIFTIGYPRGTQKKHFHSAQDGILYKGNN